MPIANQPLFSANGLGSGRSLAATEPLNHLGGAAMSIPDSASAHRSRSGLLVSSSSILNKTRRAARGVTHVTFARHNSKEGKGKRGTAVPLVGGGTLDLQERIRRGRPLSAASKAAMAPIGPDAHKGRTNWIFPGFGRQAKQLAEICADLAATSSQTIVREMWLLATQALNLICLLILHVLARSDAKKKFTRSQSEPLLRRSESSVVYSTSGVIEGSALDLNQLWAEGHRRKFSIGKAIGYVWDRFFSLPEVWSPTTAGAAGAFDIRGDEVTFFNKVTTGLFEDFYWACMAYIEHLRHALKTTLFKGHPFQFIKLMLRGALFVFDPRNMLNKSMEESGAPDLIKSEGYAYERVICVTEDNYELQLDRVARPDSRNVVYFQHGIFDSSFAWVCCGGLHSLAFIAHDQGNDVFLGNFRGNGSSYRKPPGVSMEGYWDFTMNDHAFRDMKVFVQKIQEIKRAEDPNCPFTITIVSHSMGAGCTMAYLAKCGHDGVSHGIDRVILLSPAGVHVRAPWLCGLFGKPLVWGCKALGITHLRLKNRTLRLLLGKLGKDIHRQPALRKLVCYLFSKMVTGGTEAECPLHYVHNLMYNILAGGVSIGVIEHFVQMYRQRRFEAFDFGPDENMKKYGSIRPPNLMDYYQTIQIPVYLVAGTLDTLIPEYNVRTHYERLRKFNSQVYYKRIHCGHIELTMGMSEDVLHYITTELQKPIRKQPETLPALPAASAASDQKVREGGEVATSNREGPISTSSPDEELSSEDGLDFNLPQVESVSAWSAMHQPGDFPAGAAHGERANAPSLPPSPSVGGEDVENAAIEASPAVPLEGQETMTKASTEEEESHHSPQSYEHEPEIKGAEAAVLRAVQAAAALRVQAKEHQQYKAEFPSLTTSAQHTQPQSTVILNKNIGRIKRLNSNPAAALTMGEVFPTSPVRNAPKEEGGDPA